MELQPHGRVYVRFNPKGEPTSLILNDTREGVDLTGVPMRDRIEAIVRHQGARIL